MVPTTARRPSGLKAVAVTISCTSAQSTTRCSGMFHTLTCSITPDTAERLNRLGDCLWVDLATRVLLSVPSSLRYHNWVGRDS